MSYQRKPGVAFWATVVIVAPLAYPIGFGPACWLADREVLPPVATAKVFAPLLDRASDADHSGARFNPLTWWANLGARKGGVARRLWCFAAADAIGCGVIEGCEEVFLFEP